MVTKKDRRHSGYVTPRATVSKQDLLLEDLFINDYYDEWNNYRDGLRDWFSDFKSIKNVNPSHLRFNDRLYNKRNDMNQKQKILLKRRKHRKMKFFFNFDK